MANSYGSNMARTLQGVMTSDEAEAQESGAHYYAEFEKRLGGHAHMTFSFIVALCMVS